MKIGGRSSLLILSVFFASGCFGQTLVDVTGVVGSSATFQCQGVTEWFFYPNGGQETKIAAIGSNGAVTLFLNQSNKYQIVNTNVVVNNLSLSDGVTIDCQTLSSQSDLQANLVVLGVLSPPMVMPSTSLSPGTIVQITCTLPFAAPFSNSAVRSIVPGQLPALYIYLGSTNLNANIIINNSFISAMINLTITNQMAGVPLVCSAISTANGIPTTLNTNSTLNMAYFSNAMITNLTSISSITNFNVSVSTVVNCSANGIPLPSVWWVPLTGGINPSAWNTGPGWALLTLNTVGSNILWNCQATNTATATALISNTYNFTVNKSMVSGASSLHAFSMSGACYWATLFFTVLATVFLNISERK